MQPAGSTTTYRSTTGSRRQPAGKAAARRACDRGCACAAPSLLNRQSLRDPNRKLLGVRFAARHRRDNNRQDRLWAALEICYFGFPLAAWILAQSVRSQ
jgi:hypothetical protein